MKVKKTIITFGLISGVISSGLMVCFIPFYHRIGNDRALILGYTSIVLSFLLVYFGIRSYRDNVADGHITFGKGFGIGICITLISCVFYVATWEVLERTVFQDFMDQYSATMIAKAQASGASAQVVQAKIEEMQQMKVMYANPFYNVLYTFIEPFPVGLAITLISAAVLRKKARPESAQTAAMA
jgi:prepilin signal peptidase PulO-like enzyme (type II secretory pathway)